MKRMLVRFGSGQVRTFKEGSAGRLMSEGLGFVWGEVVRASEGRRIEAVRPPGGPWLSVRWDPLVEKRSGGCRRPLEGLTWVKVENELHRRAELLLYLDVAVEVFGEWDEEEGGGGEDEGDLVPAGPDDSRRLLRV